MLNFPTLDSENILTKWPPLLDLAAVNGPKFSKQELSCFSVVHHEIIGWENWIV